MYLNLSSAAGRADVHGYIHDLDVGASVGPGPEPEVEAKDDVWEVYAHKPTGELLTIYEQQQEELVKLSKELEEFTKKNIELSTSNLQQLQKLQNTNSPIVANIVMQPPRLSQLSVQVRQQQQRRDSISALGISSLPSVTAAGDVSGGGPLGGPGEQGSEFHVPHTGHAHDDAGDKSAPQGICTQEDAAAILLQMSRRMVDDPW